MSFFSKVFGGKKEPATLTTAEAIQKLRETEEMLIKKQDFLEGKIELEIQTAKKNGTKNKRGKYEQYHSFYYHYLRTTFMSEITCHYDVSLLYRIIIRSKMKYGIQHFLCSFIEI